MHILPKHTFTGKKQKQQDDFHILYLNSMAKFTDNIKFANAGIRYFFRTERNGRIQTAVACIIFIVSCYFNITPIEWCMVLFCIGVTLSLEMVNSALERVCELVSQEYHPLIKVIKDVAAGAVLWFSIIAVLIGLIIFVPYIIKLLSL